MTRYYPLADRGPSEDYMARTTGEYRPPKPGEWYLSGAIVEAYRTPNGLTAPYQIARIVRVRRVVTIEEVTI